MSVAAQGFRFKIAEKSGFFSGTERPGAAFNGKAPAAFPSFYAPEIPAAPDICFLTQSGRTLPAFVEFSAPLQKHAYLRRRIRRKRTILPCRERINLPLSGKDKLPLSDCGSRFSAFRYFVGGLKPCRRKRQSRGRRNCLVGRAAESFYRRK